MGKIYLLPAVLGQLCLFSKSGQILVLSYVESSRYLVEAIRAERYERDRLKRR